MLFFLNCARESSIEKGYSFHAIFDNSGFGPQRILRKKKDESEILNSKKSYYKERKPYSYRPVGIYRMKVADERHQNRSCAFFLVLFIGLKGADEKIMGMQFKEVKGHGMESMKFFLLF